MTAATSMSLTPTEEKADCFRLLSLVVDGGTLVLRHKFDQAFPHSDLQKTLNDTNTRYKLTDLFKKKVLKQPQWNLLYPQLGEPSSEKFDVSLLSFLLRYICGLNEKSIAWTRKPQPSDVSTEADIARLKHIRNKVLHYNSISMSNQDFQRKWNKLEQVILRLGAKIPNLHQDIQSLRKESIDPEKERYYVELIKEWEEMDKSLQAEIASIKTDLESCSENVENIKDSLEENQNSLNEVQKQTIQNTKNIETLEQNREMDNTKLSKVETKQTELEQRIETSRGFCEEQQIIIYERLRASNTKVDSISTSLCSLQTKVHGLAVNETSTISSELAHTTSVTDLYFEDSERDDIYVTTHAHKTAKDKVNQTGCLILSGLPGEGKTMMATKLLSETTQRHHCVKLSSPSDWDKVKFNTEHPITIFIDDIFGAGALNENLLEEWNRRLPDIEQAIKAKTVKAIITTRHYILKEAKEKLRHLSIFKDENIQLLASHDLTNGERIDILQKHLNHSKKEHDSTLVTECIEVYQNTSGYVSTMCAMPSDVEGFLRKDETGHCTAMIGFPEIVCLFVRNEHLFTKGASFFGQPFLFFKKCMEELFLDEDKFLALILVWTRPNKSLKITDVEPPEISEELKTTAMKFVKDLTHSTTKILYKSLKYHQDGFLTFSPFDGTYRFSHNTVKDMVGLVAGQDYKDAVLEFADSEFFMQFVTTDGTKKDGLHIYVEQFRYEALHRAICRYMTSEELYIQRLGDYIFKRTDEKIEKKFGFAYARKRQDFADEISVDTYLLKHDCFVNKSFVSQFCESEEGKYMLTKPVDVLPKQCIDLYCDIDFGRDVPVYLPSLGLLYKSSFLLKEVFKQNLHKNLNTTAFLQSTLLIASRQGLKDIIELLLKHGATVNEDALFLAAAKGRSESLEYMLQNYAGNCTDCPNSINKNSSLIAASKCGAVDCMKLLIRHGTNINYRNKNGWSALDKAVLYAQSESCKILLENKAVASCKAGKFKRTPLHMNADIGDEIITKMLLQYGASIKVKDYRGHFPVHCAAFSGHNEIVDILLQEDKAKVTLKHSVSYGKKSIIKGANLYHVAVLENNPDLIDILLQNKLCPNMRDSYGRTPLYLAVYGCENKEKEMERRPRPIENLEKDMKIKVIQKLLKHTDVNLAEKDGYTPLHAAVHKGQIEIVKLLGPLADVNARDKYGKTPLHTACDQVDFEIFMCLVVDFRADYRMRTKSGKSIFDILADKTEWRNIRRRYKTGKRVTYFTKECPPFKSFRDFISAKDPDFVTQTAQILGIAAGCEVVGQDAQSEGE